MTEEKVNEGKKLLDKLSRLKTQKDTWEKCTGISELRLEIGRSTVGLTNPHLLILMTSRLWLSVRFREE